MNRLLLEILSSPLVAYWFTVVLSQIPTNRRCGAVSLHRIISANRFRWLLWIAKMRDGSRQQELVVLCIVTPLLVNGAYLATKAR